MGVGDEDGLDAIHKLFTMSAILAANPVKSETGVYSIGSEAITSRSVVVLTEFPIPTTAIDIPVALIPASTVVPNGETLSIPSVSNRIILGSGSFLRMFSHKLRAEPEDVEPPDCGLF